MRREAWYGRWAALWNAVEGEGGAEMVGDEVSMSKVRRHGAGGEQGRARSREAGADIVTARRGGEREPRCSAEEASAMRVARAWPPFLDTKPGRRAACRDSTLRRSRR